MNNDQMEELRDQFLKQPKIETFEEASEIAKGMLQAATLSYAGEGKRVFEGNEFVMLWIFALGMALDVLYDAAPKEAGHQLITGAIEGIQSLREDLEHNYLDQTDGEEND